MQVGHIFQPHFSTDRQFGERRFGEENNAIAAAVAATHHEENTLFKLVCAAAAGAKVELCPSTGNLS